MLEFILASTDAASEAPNFLGQLGSTLIFIVPLILLFALPYFMNRKRDKQMKEMLDNMKVGDNVRTIGGIYGTIHQVKDDRITLAVGPDKVKIVFAKGAIATVENTEDEKTLEEGTDK